jgi:hypothetical protein
MKNCFAFVLVAIACASCMKEATCTCTHDHMTAPPETYVYTAKSRNPGEIEKFKQDCVAGNLGPGHGCTLN